MTAAVSQDGAEAALPARLGVEIGPDLLARALTHRSWAFEAGGAPTNERLEFLGDAVLALVVADALHAALPEAPEGRLSKIRANAVMARSLADVARELDLGAAVRLGRGEETSGGRDKDSILADALEAVIGAVYVEHGFGVAADLVRRLFDPLLAALVEARGHLDHKTPLQELSAALHGLPPVYDVTEDGPDHAKRFHASVTIDGEQLGVGEGRSKKEAEQSAARQALAELDRRAQSQTPSPASAE